MITGAHTIIYSKDSAADLAFYRASRLRCPVPLYPSSNLYIQPPKKYKRDMAAAFRQKPANERSAC